MYDILKSEMVAGGGYNVEIQIRSMSLKTFQFSISVQADHAHLYAVVRQNLYELGQELQKACAP